MTVLGPKKSVTLGNLLFEWDLTMENFQVKFTFNEDPWNSHFLMWDLSPSELIRVRALITEYLDSLKDFR